jgi:hypothetical protein
MFITIDSSSSILINFLPQNVSNARMQIKDMKPMIPREMRRNSIAKNIKEKKNIIEPAKKSINYLQYYNNKLVKNK